MMIFTAVVAVVLAGVALGLGGFLPSKRRDALVAGAALKKLLLERAAGSLSAEEFAQRQEALHKTLLAAPAETLLRRNLGWAVPVLVALLAVVLYAVLGNPQGLQVTPPLATGMAAAPDAAPANAGGDLKVVVKRLAEKMEKEPANGEGWLLLARTHGELHQHREAAAAYAKAAALLKPDAALLADWADAYVMAHGRQWDDEARNIVQRALAADPKHLKSLALAGSAAFDRADYKTAIDYWQRMKAAAPADSMDAKLAMANIDEAKAMMSGKRPVAPTAADAAAAGISGTVTLDAAFKDKVAPTDTVFVVAKAPDGSGAPLAVKRFTAAAFPIAFQLADGDAMMPGRTLSAFGEALVSARVSRSGNAVAQSGDIASPGARVKAGTTGVTLVLGVKR